MKHVAKVYTQPCTTGFYDKTTDIVVDGEIIYPFAEVTDDEIVCLINDIRHNKLYYGFVYVTEEQAIPDEKYLVTTIEFETKQEI